MMKTFTLATIAMAAQATGVMNKSADHTAGGVDSHSGVLDHGLDDYTHEELYGDMRDNIEDYVLMVDQDMDGYGTLEEFLNTVQEHQANWLVQAYGNDYMWWRDADLMAEIMHPIFDLDSDYHLSEYEIQKLFDSLTPVSTDFDGVYDHYVADKLLGMSLEEFTDFLYDWTHGQLKGGFKPSWADYTQEELYGGMMSQWPEWIDRFDQNGDGIVPLREFARFVKSPNVDEIVNKYGEDHMWWKDGACLRDCTTHYFDKDQDGFYSYDEVLTYLVEFGVDGDYDLIFKKYQPDSNELMDSDTMGMLLEAWTFGMFEAHSTNEIQEVWDSLYTIGVILEDQFLDEIEKLPQEQQAVFTEVYNSILQQKDHISDNFSTITQNIYAEHLASL